MPTTPSMALVGHLRMGWAGGAQAAAVLAAVAVLMGLQMTMAAVTMASAAV